jgi:hypothetical protein
MTMTRKSRRAQASAHCAESSGAPGG